KSPVNRLSALAADTAKTTRKHSRTGNRLAKPTANPATMLSYNYSVLIVGMSILVCFNGKYGK
ncbi:MAG: hypothetical protein IJ214_02820, partial [Clostridia bacterium]|nr:hypothetical protein [Clostridia bacterium]